MKSGIKIVIVLTTALVGATNAYGQQSYYGRYFGFGDSLTDNGRVLRETGVDTFALGLAAAFGGMQPPPINIYEGGRMSNGLNYYEVVPNLIGLPYRAGDDFAVAGSRAIHLAPTPLNSPAFSWGVPDQIDQAIARVGRFGPRDLLNIWIGYNDITAYAATSGAARAAVAPTIVGDTVSAINKLAAAGGRSFVVFNQKTDRPDAMPTGFGPSVPMGGNDIAAAINAQLPQALTPLSAAGLSVHYFDVSSLIARLRASPRNFGFGSDANTPCLYIPACFVGGAANGGVIENQYISPDSIHNTGRTNQWIAAFLGNQLNAPLTIGPQAELGQAAGTAFSSTLIDFAGNERRGNVTATASSGDSTDSNNAQSRSSATPVQPGSPLSVFVLGTYLNVDRKAQDRGSEGWIGDTFNADLGGATVGAVYRMSPNLSLGLAFNHLGTRVDLGGLSGGRIRMNSYQGAGFASLSLPNIFADAAFTYGVNQYSLDRPGALGDRLTASPSGNTLSVATRAGYLVDLQSIQVGPVAELSYTNVSVDAYREQGDELLTIGAHRQRLENLSAGAGVQIRARISAFDGSVSPFLNVTAQRDFLDSVRTVTSFQTYAPTLTVRTETGRDNADVYGRMAGGVDLSFGNGLGGSITGAISFARKGGDERKVNVGLRYKF